jgi:hypothetical protein
MFARFASFELQQEALQIPSALQPWQQHGELFLQPQQVFHVSHTWGKHNR